MTWDIPRLWKRTRALEREIGRLGHRIRGARTVIGASVFVGLLVAALAKMGLGWIRCSRVKSTGKRLCGMDAGLLDSLLTDTLLIAGTLSLVEFAREMVGVTDTAVRPITTFWRAN